MNGSEHCKTACGLSVVDLDQYGSVIEQFSHVFQISNPCRPYVGIKDSEFKSDMNTKAGELISIRVSMVKITNCIFRAAKYNKLAGRIRLINITSISLVLENIILMLLLLSNQLL